MLIVDAANVVGSRPDGWWRDRAGAANRLIARITAALESELLDGPVTVVLEGRARQAGPSDAAGDPAPVQPTVTVDRAPASGDDRIVELVREATAAIGPVTVVTADRELIGRVRSIGARIEGPGTFLRLLDRISPEAR